MKPASVKKTKNRGKVAICAGAAALMTLTARTHAQSTDDALINKLEQKGILSVDEAKELRAETESDQTNLVNSALMATKWKISDSIKSIEIFGDVRMRYEYRSAENPTPNDPGPNSTPSSGATGSTYDRERFRYALRIGVRGDLYDDFNYGLRLETSNNPRSPWVTFANDTGSSSTQSATTPAGGTPSDKSNDGIYLGQIYLGWHPTGWFQMTVGRMPMPLYTTTMVWDADINPEGAFEKFKFDVGNVELFADFGQFDYQDPTATSDFPSGDTFLLAWQAGVNVKCGPDMAFKIAPVLYTYAGKGNPPAAGATPNIYSPYYAFVGQGDQYGLNGSWNQAGINDLLIMEIPEEFDFKINNTPLGTLQARIFGDVAYNFAGDDRAQAAYNAGNGAAGAFPGMSSPPTGQNEAYQVGFGIGSAGPVYGPTQGYVYGSASKKNNWEFRFYYQKVEQYALDVNLMDSDFFEGRANLEGYYTAFAYSFTDSIIGTVRYGYATRIDNQLGTGGNNLDIPNINPINNYNLFQLDLTWRL
jgi:Putative porin